MANKLYQITRTHEMGENQVNYVRAVSISAAIEKWTERGEGWHEEKDIFSIIVLVNDIDNYKVVYWD